MESPTTRSATSTSTSRHDASRKHVPLVVHIIYKLDVGGLENGLVNLINAIPQERYRHAVVCLTDFTEFRARIRREDVDIYALKKRPGKDLGLYVRLWRLLRSLRPDIVHTRNLGTVDCQLPAAIAGCAHRIHGEHGRDMVDVDGSNVKYLMLRRAVRPLIHRFIPVSRDLEYWLRDKVGVPESKIWRIYNGVDAQLFQPASGGRAPLPMDGFASPDSIVIGTVGRLQTVKDQLTLARAFVRLQTLTPEVRERLRLVIVGDGPLLGDVREILRTAGITHLAWLPGAREDVPAILRGMDIFVLPSLAEGISNTILEAMASGLPVVATRVGGTPEIVSEGVTGLLVPPGDPEAMAQRIQMYIRDDELRLRHGAAARESAVRDFSLDRMMQQYVDVYDAVLSS